MARRHSHPDLVLDDAIDALLAGLDWRKHVPSTHPHRRELLELLDVAKLLHEVSHSLSPVAPPVRNVA